MSNWKTAPIGGELENFKNIDRNREQGNFFVWDEICDGVSWIQKNEEACSRFHFPGKKRDGRNLPGTERNLSESDSLKSAGIALPSKTDSSKAIDTLAFLFLQWTSVPHAFRVFWAEWVGEQQNSGLHNLRKRPNQLQDEATGLGCPERRPRRWRWRGSSRRHC